MTSIITSQSLRLLISLFFLIIAINYRRYFLLIIPFLQYAGFIFMVKGRPPEMNFIICYAELLVLGIFALRRGFRIKDKTSLYLFLFPLLSLPSLLFAQGNFYQSVFIITLLSLSAFLYQFYLKNMEWLIRKNIFNLIVLIWSLFGILTKIFQGIKWGFSLASYMPIGLYGILSRGGGIGGSNHVGGIILFFLPFVNDYRIITLASIFLLFTFSRGIYIVLLLFWIIKFYPFIKVKKITVKAFALFVILICLIWVITPQSYTTAISNWMFQRMGLTEHWGTTLNKHLINLFYESPRWGIYKEALDIFKKTLFQGVGLGGFYWGEKFIGEESLFSNAHNLYLTLLSEGGIFFFLGFILLLGYMFHMASKYSHAALLSLIIFSIYGLFSGEIYEASGLASACDYYYLIFLLAYLKYMKKLKSNRAFERNLIIRNNV